MKRILAILVLIVISAASLMAAPRFFLGAAFNYDAGGLVSNVRNEFEGLDGAYHDDEVTALQAVGPKFELIIFPFGNLPVGIGINSVTMLTVGYADGGGNVTGYFSYNNDFREDLGLNLYYQQSFSPMWGLFIDFGFTYSWYRIATSNKANSRLPVDYHWATTYGLSSNLGAYIEHGNSYFKAGAALYYDLRSSSEAAFRYGLTLGGGFTFD